MLSRSETLITLSWRTHTWQSPQSADLIIVSVCGRWSERTCIKVRRRHEELLRGDAKNFAAGTMGSMSTGVNREGEGGATSNDGHFSGGRLTGWEWAKAVSG